MRAGVEPAADQRPLLLRDLGGIAERHQPHQHDLLVDLLRLSGNRLLRVDAHVLLRDAGVVAADGSATFAQVKAIIDQRCVLCHNASIAQKNVRVDTQQAIARQAQQIYQQVVLMRLMPLGNATQITEEERALIGRWFNAGAHVPSGS